MTIRIICGAKIDLSQFKSKRTQPPSCLHKHEEDDNYCNKCGKFIVREREFEYVDLRLLPETLSGWTIVEDHPNYFIGSNAAHPKDDYYKLHDLAIVHPRLIDELELAKIPILDTGVFVIDIYEDDEDIFTR